MSAEEHNAILVITNHFKDAPVNPKIVYANQHFLNLVNSELKDIAGANPSIIFNNWNKDQFIAEIVNCVDQKISWIGNLEVIDKQGKISLKQFVITPVFNIKGEVNYYSCTCNVENICDPITHECLDAYVDSMNEIYKQFQDVCEKSPASLLKINNEGTIEYVNVRAQQQYGLTKGTNFFEFIQDSKAIKKSFTNKKTIGKINKVDFDFFNDKTWSVQCKYWPINDDNNNIVGYSLVLIDHTKKKEMTKQLLALKGI